MSKLPAGWSIATMQDIADVQLGKMLDAAKNMGVPVPYLRNINVRWGSFDLSDVLEMRMTTEEQVVYSIHDGDVLICEGGEPGRAAVWCSGQTNIKYQKALHRARTCTGVAPKLVAFYMQHAAAGGKLESRFTGTTIKHLPLGAIREMPVPVPPSLEQRRIVAKIDSLSAKSRRAHEHLDHIPRLVEKYKQAILAAAYTEAQRHSERAATLGEISLEVRNGLSKKPSDNPSGFPILRISAVRSMSVRLDDVRYYPETVPEVAQLRDGDLLFTRYNGNPDFTAVCGAVRGLTCRTAYPDKLIRVRLSEAADPKFVEVMSAAAQSRDWLAPHIKTAAGQHGISGADLKMLPIPLPSICHQQIIARRIDAAFTWLDRLASETTSARKLIGHLDQAILARVFRGELVPQDPNDEPASVLLERIRAEREARSSPKHSTIKKKK